MQRSFSNPVDGSSFLSGQVKPVEMSEILATLPPKPEVDKLIDQYFDRKNFAIPIARKSPRPLLCTCQRLTAWPAVLHQPTFMHEVLILPEFRHTVGLISQ